MQCPVDNETLVMTDRNGVEIDYCPKCRGVWLDRGELDKILERSQDTAPQQARTPMPQQAAPIYQKEPQAHVQTRNSDRDQGHDDRRRDRDYDNDDDDRRYGRKRGKRESFLSELFDF